MIIEISHKQNELEQKSTIELDELGVLITGMNKTYLDYLPEKKRTQLSITQNELIKACNKKEIPVILLHNSIYGKITSSLKNTLSSHYMHEIVKDYQCGNSELNSILDKWEIKNIILTGTNLFCIENIVQDTINKTYEIITSKQLIATPENDKPAFKKQITWFENNGIYFPDHEDLLNIIYQK